MVRQLANESNGIGEQCNVAIADVDFARERVERREQAVFDEHTGITRERAEDRRLARVRVSNKRNAELICPALPLHFACAFDICQSITQHLDAMLHETTVGFELRFTGTTHADADTATRLLQVRPHPRQPRQHVFELREFDLQACFVRSRTRCENVENEFRAIHHARVHRKLDVATLCWSKLVVENDKRRTELVDSLFEFVDLAAAEIRCGVGSVELLRQRTDNNNACRVRKPCQFLEMFVDLMTSSAALRGSTDENCALDRRFKRDVFLADLSILAKWTVEANAGCRSSWCIDRSGHTAV